MSEEIYVCQTEDIDEEDVRRFDYEDRTYCVYHTPDGFFATDGFCTHEEQHLEDGIVIDTRPGPGRTAFHWETMVFPLPDAPPADDDGPSKWRASLRRVC